MQAIILAGGFGTRLRSVVADVPKPMAPISERPFLAILLSSLAAKGFTRVVLSTGYMSQKISSYFGSSFGGIDITYCVEEEPLGTGGAIRLALDHCTLDHVYIMNGDTFLDIDVAALEAHWQLNKNPIIVGRAVEDTARYGSLSRENGKVIGFEEKGVPGAGIINAGCYIFNRDQLDDFAVGDRFSIENDYLAYAVTRSAFDLFVSDGLFIDIGIPEDFERAQTLLREF